MRLSTTRLFPLALMLALAGLTFWLEHATRVEEKTPALRRHDPDYILTRFTTTTYGASGEALTQLAAARMVHFPDDDSTELVAPRVVQSKPDQPRVTVRADRGTLSREGDEIHVGGWFTTANRVPAGHWARWGCEGTTCPADWNADGQVNSTDISAFLSGWLASVQGGNLAADFNADSAVNSSDISAFLTAWLAAVQGGC